MTTRLFPFLALLGLSACQSAERDTSALDEPSAEEVMPEPESDQAYTFVFLESGEAPEQLSAEQIREAGIGHQANIQRLGQERLLLLAGPFGEPPLESNQRGIFVFDVADPARARELTASDPAVQAGVFAMSAFPWHSDAPLRELHESELARQQSGQEFVGRAYVMGIGSPASLTIEALDALRAADKLVFSGEFKGQREGEVLFVLTTDSVDEAHEWLANMPGGADVNWTLGAWYATDLLMNMIGVTDL